MKTLGPILASLALALLLATPAAAQGAGSVQYGDCDPGTNVYCAESIGDATDAIAGNSADGSAILNDALSDDSSGASGTTAAASASATAGLDALPETGGAIPLAPVAGVLLVCAGLLIRRSSIRRG